METIRAETGMSLVHAGTLLGIVQVATMLFGAFIPTTLTRHAVDVAPPCSLHWSPRRWRRCERNL
ncbi:hypothetical protein [Auritidibacter ignavus]|uniref:hypothetical protein n=1 Tax=Auritidibacter ignavus TaxID=678932 RepID=UPI00244D2273|nr:hypothetical protein [Auritidibacter ignavus]WGH82899.1 hypothetical protein QDX20_06265 [Auritidibacter ignavus]